jgi:hypothetical protein
MINFIKSAPWTFAIGGVILLLAIVGVVVGVVLKGRWEDNGWMMREGKELKWAIASLPIVILLHPDLSELAKKLVQELKDHFERIAGNSGLFMMGSVPRMLNWDHMPPTGFLAVIPCSAARESKDSLTTLYGHCEHRYEKAAGRILSARITLPSGLKASELAKVIQHELCHALGLGHDEVRDSIMHPKIQNRAQVITEHDKQLLRDQYGA